MNGSLRLFALFILSLPLFLSPETSVAERWRAAFDSTGVKRVSTDTAFTFTEVLQLVASQNPTLKSLVFEELVASGRLKQAGLWANPEFETEFEEVLLDAPGFEEPEITISLSQELELFGQRGARKELARTQLEATRLQTKLSAFDLYIETKRRFYVLAHAQQRLYLDTVSLELANDIIENIRFRIDKGASLQSELALAQLEQQRIKLRLQKVKNQVRVAKTSLTSLWNGSGGDHPDYSVVSEVEPDLSDIQRRLQGLDNRVDSTRQLLKLKLQTDLTRAEKSLAVAEARPAITLTGGFKRFESNNSNSLLFGIRVPLPILNRNQGTRESLEARIRSLSYKMDRARRENSAAIESAVSTLEQLSGQHATLDTLLVPTAEDAYKRLQSAYEAGRLPYTQLLEAERSLNGLRFEHNDILLELQQQIMKIESLTGMTLRTDLER